MKYIFFIFIIGLASRSWSYPDFIGYGYASCLTCHYNGQGNGPLNDYGRALWAAEISSRAFIDKKVTDEQLGEKSGFPAKTPWWVKPGVKYRGLYNIANPGSSESTSKYYTMQANVNAAFFFDPDQKLIFVGDFGYIPTPGTSTGSTNKLSNWISREHYLRWQINDEYFTYFGLTDKVYGIRIVDHTAYSRDKTGNNKNDQTYGVIIQRVKAPYEYTAHLFMGNLTTEANVRQKGFSIMVEKDLTQYNRVGGSLLMSNNEFVQWLRMTGHNKIGFGKGNSLLVELGMIQNKPKTTKAETGFYGIFEGNALIERGYSLFSQVEYHNQTMTVASADEFRWAFGLLAFPYPRYEVRFTFANGRTLRDSQVTNDQTILQAQLHISL